MSDALIPLNQQWALPLYSTVFGASSGLIYVIGNTMTRLWSGPALGLSSVGAPGSWVNEGAPQWNLKSALLDFRGCSRFSLVCTITNGTGIATGITWSLYLVQATSAGVTPVINADKANSMRVGNIQSGAINPGDSRVRNTEFSAFGIPATPPFGIGAVPGALWRLVLNTINPAQSSNGIAVACELWGAS